MVHDVVLHRRDVTAPGMQISVDSLRYYIEELLRQGREFRSLRELSGEAGPESTFLTFDDAFRSFLDRATPVLSEYKLPCCLFVPVGFLGMPGHLSEEEVALLAREDEYTIGSHSVSHPVFRRVSLAQARMELEESRLKLESLCERPIPDFAFPYGSRYACSRRDIRLANGIYDQTFSTVSASVSRRAATRGSFLPRKNLCEAFVMGLNG